MPRKPKTIEQDEIKALKAKLENAIADLEESFEVKSLGDISSASSMLELADYSSVDKHISAEVLQAVYKTETWVYVAVNAIADTIAALPLVLKKKQIITKKQTNPYTGAEESVKTSIWTDASGEPLASIFEYPSQSVPTAEFFKLLLIDLLTVGEYYIYLDAKNDQEFRKREDTTFDILDNQEPFDRLERALAADSPVKEMHRVPPGLLEPVLDSKAPHGVVGYVQKSQNKEFVYHKAEIIHVKLPDPSDPKCGLSPLVAAFKQVLMDRFATEHMIRFYKSGARLGGVITTEGRTFNKEQTARFQRSFEANFTGKKNHHRTLILPPGMDYKSIEQNPADMALLEFCRFNREAILSAFRVPPIKVGIMDGANYANARVQLQTFFKSTVKPLLASVESGFNYKRALVPRGVYKTEFDLSQVEELQDDLVTKGDAANKMLTSGLSVNEIRELVWKKTKVEGGDVVPAIEKSKAPAPVPGQIPGASALPAPAEPAKAQHPLVKLISDMLAQLDPSEPVTPGLISELMAAMSPQPKSESVIEAKVVEPTPSLTESAVSPITAPEAPISDSVAPVATLLPRLSKDETSKHWKGFIDKTDPLVEKRHGEVVKWFKGVQTLVTNRIGENVKSYGLTKARDNDDIDEILDPKAFKELIDKYIAEVDAALLDAYKQGYTDTIVSVQFGPPNEAALAYLKEWGAKEVTQILDTTRDQMRAVLSKAFEEGVAINETVMRIREKFTEIGEGRAWTIARTETLSAVSQGQLAKREDVKEQFPNRKIVKTWLSAQDERVRDEHKEVDGETVSEDDNFSNGLAYPRDPDGPPESIINCRCSVISDFASEESDSE